LPGTLRGVNDDQQLLTSVDARHPEKRATFEAGLRAVNQYIADARRWAEQHPSDPEARRYLLQAYQQKAMIYDLGQQESLP
jgi:hypothetical protein